MVVDDDGGQLPRPLLRHSQQLPPILAEFRTLDAGREVPRLEQLARLHFPQAQGVVRAAGGEEGGGGVDVDGPEGALVAFVGAEALAVGAVPGADDVVFGDGEDEVAFFAESVRLC